MGLEIPTFIKCGIPDKYHMLSLIFVIETLVLVYVRVNSSETGKV